MTRVLTRNSSVRPLLVAAMFATFAMAAAAGSAATTYLEFDNHGLEDLGHGWVYEGWLIVDGSPVSTGTFTIDGDGSAHPSRFAVPVDPATAATFVLTIEPVPDADPGPSAVHVLAGDFGAGVAELTAGHPAALGDDFTSAAGSFILAAPSAGDGGDYHNGIWWLDPAGGPAATLELATLPAGWVYEGWVVGPGGPMSTGRFSDPAMADSDGQGITGGPYGAPPFPGQDLVVPPVNLSGYAAVISIEPDPDTSPAPFTFKPLVDGAIEDVGMGTLQAMTNQASDMATATVRMVTSADHAETAHLALSFSGLEDLGPDSAYEGWLIVDGAPVSTGTFTVDGDGVPSQEYFPTTVSSVADATAFILTIEPVPDSDPAPSAVHFLAGDLVNGRAQLAIGHGAAIGTDFSSASGAYILNAPSAGAGGDYRNGIWWLDPDTGPGPALSLPALPDGWVYEGWIASANGPVSTGRFTSPSGVDSDGAGTTSGPEGAPPFPGQDFVNPPTDLTTGFAAVLSVEPEPDNSPAPFTLKPLMDPVIDDVGAGILQPMHRNPAAMPWGTAVIMDQHIIAAAANNPGVGDVQWRTDLELSHDGQGLARVFIQLLRTGQANLAPATVEMTIAGGSVMRISNVIGSLFDVEDSGAIRVLTDATGVRVASRTYADTDDGTYGQGIPAASWGQAIRFGDAAQVLQLVRNDDFRSNLGLVNLGDGEITIHVDLLGADGSSLGEITQVLAGGEHLQLNQVLPATANAARARVWTSTPGGAFLAYGSVVDNLTDDPTYVSAS